MYWRRLVKAYSAKVEWDINRQIKYQHRNNGLLHDGAKYDMSKTYQVKMLTGVKPRKHVNVITLNHTFQFPVRNIEVFFPRHAPIFI